MSWVRLLTLNWGQGWPGTGLWPTRKLAPLPWISSDLTVSAPRARATSWSVWACAASGISSRTAVSNETTLRMVGLLAPFRCGSRFRRCLADSPPARAGGRIVRRSGRGEELEHQAVDLGRVLEGRPVAGPGHAVGVQVRDHRADLADQEIGGAKRRVVP